MFNCKLKFNNFHLKDFYIYYIFQDTTNTKSIQSFGQAQPLIHIPELFNCEKIFIPTKEKNSKENDFDKLEKIKLIQKNFRAFLIRKFIRDKAAEFR